MSRSVTETFAPIGCVPMPSTLPRLPAAPAKIALAIIEASEAGVSIIFPETRDSQSGKPGPRHLTDSCWSPGNQPLRPSVSRTAAARAAKKGSSTGSNTPGQVPDALKAVRHVTVVR